MPLSRQVLALSAARRDVRLRHHPVHRPPLPPPGRGRHPVLRHGRLRLPGGPTRSRCATATRPSRCGCRSTAWPRRSPGVCAAERLRSAGRLGGSLNRHACPVRHGQEPPMPFVFDFDHKHRRPPMELKDLLGGKGANLAEMTSVLRLPVPHGFTITTDACRAYMDGGWPEGLSAEVKRARARLEKKMGKHLGRPRRPAAGQRPVGCEVLHARDDGHRPQPRAQRPVGAGPGQADRRRALRLRLLPPLRVDVRAHRARHPRRGLRHAARGVQGALRRRHRRRHPAEPAPRPGLRLQADRARPHRHRLPPGPRRPAAGGHRSRVRLVERAAGLCLPRPRGHRPRPRHRRQRPGHGVRQPRRPARGRASGSPATPPPAPRASTATSSSTPRARTWWPASATPSRSRRCATSSPGSTPSSSPSSPGWSATTATCATPSSPSSRASSGCCRPASASARGAPRCGWRWR